MATPPARNNSASSEKRKSYIEHGINVVQRTIHYYRGFQKVITENKQTYLRGSMAVRDCENNEYMWFDTIERMDGAPWLRPGFYNAAMENSVDAKNPGRQQIRPVHTQRNSENRICNFLIHPSAKPHFLTGCIAPGTEDVGGLLDSSDSLELIFDCLGGFQPGKQVFLRVDGAMPKR